MMNRNGFTLMEILISLGIVGVVAAVTIPSLVSSTNNKNIGNALARSVELIQQGFTNIKGQYFPNVREISFEKGQLCSNLGKLVAQTTKEEDDFLINNYLNMTTKEIACILNRPEYGVKARKNKLK